MDLGLHLNHIDLNTKWSNYNQTRLKGDKKTANKILNSFIDDLLKENPDTLETFVYDLCQLTLEHLDGPLSNNGTQVSELKNRIQHPLFKSVILPVLIRKYKAGDALYTRWIGQFEPFFYSDPTMTQQFLEEIDAQVREAVQLDLKTQTYTNKTSRYFSAEHFFERAYQIEPEQKTLDRLLKRLAQDLFYATHELPTGILRDADVFIKEIERFRSYFERSNDQKKWDETLKHWEHLAKHWKIYSINKDQYQNFEQYLSKNNIKIQTR